MAKAKSNGYGIASLVLGIVSVVIFWIPLIGLVPGILSLIFANKQKRIYPNGITTAGFILGIVGIVLGELYNLVYLLMIIAIIVLVQSPAVNVTSFS